MGIEQTALELIPLVYDAALAPEKWPAFMGPLVQAMGARSAIMRAVDNDIPKVGLCETFGYDPQFTAAYRNHFVRLDPYAAGLKRAAVGVVIPTEAVITWGERNKTEYHNDYERPQGIFNAVGCILARDDNHNLLFAVQRGARAKPFGEDAEALALLRIVMPHIARAMQVHRQLAEVTTQKYWALSALDRLRVGVVLLNVRGSPIYINQAAEHLTSGGHGFGAGRDGLTVSSPSQTAALRQLVADVARLATERGGTGGGSLRVNSPRSGEAALQFQVIPLARDLSEQPWDRSSHDGCVAVFLSALGGPQLPWQRIAAMHGLTRAEAKLASMLAQGTSMEEASRNLLVSFHTVRCQLRSIFAKTGVTRQAELVALLLNDILTDQLDRDQETSL